VRSFVRRTLAGDAGAGCGLSLGFKLLNLYDPYAASLVGRAGEEPTEADCAGGSVVDLVDDAGRDVRTRVEGGDDSAEAG
jgi:hypothetical protein